MGDIVTIAGNVGSDPQFITTKTGTAITRFSVATTHRQYDKASGTWIDKDTNWYSVSAFRQVAENAHASISRGDPVIVIGRMVHRTWEANGRNGTSIDIEADTVGLDLRWGVGSIQRRSRERTPVHANDDSGPVEGSNWAESAPIEAPSVDIAEAAVPF
jgi:single-strand DNA-binding protein